MTQPLLESFGCAVHGIVHACVTGRNFKIQLAFAIAAAVLFVLLAGHWFFNLLPAYEANLAQSDVLAAADLRAMGPAWYYSGLALLALLTASLLAAASAYLIVRGVRARMAGKSENPGTALVRLFAKAPAQAGGYLTHLGLGIILAGLVGSAMYVTDRTFSYTATGQTAEIGAYTLTLVSEESYYDEDYNSCSNVVLSVARDGEEIAVVNPALQFTAKSYYGQSRVFAETIGNPFEDLFIVYQGHDTSGAVIVNVRINPMISLVWLGFGVLSLGIACAMWPKRGSAALRVVEAPAVQKADA